MADMQALLNAFLDMLMSVFPTSPFASAIDELEQLPYLGYLNWVIRVSQMLTIGTAWLVAIGLYYLYSVIARGIKLIQ